MQMWMDQPYLRLAGIAVSSSALPHNGLALYGKGSTG